MSLFGFNRDDLHKLIRLLHIPHRIELSNGSVFTGEAVLLFSCYRYTSADSILKFFYRFGRDPTQLTRAFQWFNTFMRSRWSYLLKDNLEFWKPHLPRFADAIRLKMIQKSNGRLHYLPGQFKVFAFIDDNVSHICRPGTGPDYQGTRSEKDEQRGYYNGWKKHVGIKYQSLELPCGLSMDLYGPLSFRRHDLDLVTGSPQLFE
jgi:hypothetical protein